jgi:gluconokinase
MASGTGLLNVHTMTWDEQVLAICGITASQLSPLVDLGPHGIASAEYRERWPELAGAHWYPALGDGACANVGSGAIGADTMALTIGTSAAMRMILPREAGTDWRIPDGLWGYRLDRELAVLGGALSNGGNFLRWVRDTAGGDSPDDAMRAAYDLEPDAAGLTILPFLAGERSPSWLDNATGMFAGVTLSTSPEELLRASMEAIGYRLASIQDALDPLADDPYAIVVSGGAILSSPDWMQIIADILEHDLDALHPDDETTARGAAIMAMLQERVLDGLDDPRIRQPTNRITANLNHALSYQRGRERQMQLEFGLREIGQLS